MIDHMIRDADKDKDGFINYSEYAAITQSNKHWSCSCVLLRSMEWININGPMNKEVFGSNRNLNDLEKTVLWINEATPID